MTDTMTSTMTAPPEAAQRETDAVSDLPPPPPPAPSFWGSGDWNEERVREVAERWFRPLLDDRGWRALLYLAIGALAPAMFGLTVAAAAVAFGLSFIAVGLLLIIPFFALVTVFTDFERLVAGVAGHEIERRPQRQVDGVGFGANFRAIGDPVRWRRVGFIAANALLGPLMLAVGAFPVSVTFQTVFGSGLLDGSGWFGLVGGVNRLVALIVAIPIVAVALGAIPRVAIWMAGIKAEFDRWFLGADRLAAAEARVSTLSVQRQDILDAVASERRRIERNLHDGVQQQLVAIGLDLGMAANHLDDNPEQARELIGSARDKVQGSIGELRQLGRGLHPAILEDRGIDAALSAVVSGSPIPISVQVDADLDLTTDTAETVYFIANEAIANVLKHAKARVASVHVAKLGDHVRVTIHDDGRGGADPAGGTGLAGIRARVNAVDGVLTLNSPEGGPTTITAELRRRG